MRKTARFFILLFFAVIAGVSIAAYRAFNIKILNPKISSKVVLLKLPTAFQDLEPGMTENEVVSKVGPPWHKSINSKFEHKTSNEWNKIQQQADDLDQKNSDPGAPTNLQFLIINAKLEHRTKDIWKYQPNSQLYAVLSFDEESKLLKVGTGIVYHPRQQEHQGPTSPPTKTAASTSLH